MRSASRRSASAPINSAPMPAGGISFLFSDMLGDHLIGATVQTTNRVEETGALADLSESQVAVELGLRWSITCRMSTGGFAQGLATVDGQEVLRASRPACDADQHRRAAASCSIRSAGCIASSSGGLPPHRLRCADRDAVVLADHRRAARRAGRGAAAARCAESRRGHRRARVRFVGVWRHQPAGGAAVSIRIFAARRAR